MAQTTTGVASKNTGGSLTATEFNSVNDTVNANSSDAESRIAALEALPSSAWTDVSTATNYTVPDNTNNYRIYVDTTSSAITITTIAGAANRHLMIIDDGDNAGTNIITVTGSITDTIEADSGSKEYAWDVTDAAWDLTGAVTNYFKRTASTGIIRPQAPDKLAADSIGGGLESSVTTTRTVTGGDFTNIGANVDQQATYFQNGTETASEPFNDPLQGGLGYSTTPSSPYTLTGDFSNLQRAFDGDTASNVAVSEPRASLPSTIGIETGASRTITHYRVYPRTNIPGSEPAQFELQGFNGSTWDVLDTRNTAADGSELTVSSPGSYANYRINVIEIADTGETDCWINEIELYETVPATTSNEFESSYATGSGTFAPATTVVLDQSSTPFSGSGVLNVAYNVDAGGFNALEDLETFKARADITYASSFAMKFQLVGSQTLSSAAISTPEATAEIGTDGVFRLTASGNVVIRLGDGDVLFKGLPTSDPSEEGALWNNSGVLNISAG